MASMRMTDDEDRASKVEAQKQDQLAKQKQGKQHWNEELASDSESNVRAIIRDESGEALELVC